MTVTKRLTGALVVLAVLLGGVLLLRPTGSTLAAWSDEVTVEVPALRMGGVAVTVAPAPGAATATLGMSGDVSGTWRPSAVTVAADGRALTGTQLAGSAVEYRLAAANGTCPTTTATFTVRPSGSGTSFPVTGGQDLSGQRTMCLTFVPSDQVRLQLGGRALSFTTTVSGVVDGAGTWTASAGWAATQQLPAAPSVPGPTCSRGTLNQSVTLSWEWDRAGLSQNVARWSLQLQDRGTWREVDSLSAANRSARISAYQFDFIGFDTYTLRVVGVLPDGTTIPSTSTSQVRVERIGFGAAYCQ